ncbi:MAG TPA: hypothetical protein VI911_01120 [Patescibacteria group bacterium]|nr:hypothetical protein [Patescibacteria group bacterium]
MFTIGAKIKILGSSLLRSMGPCTGSTGYVSQIDHILMEDFGAVQEVTIFFDRFGYKSSGGRCEKKRVLNIVPFETPPSTVIKMLRKNLSFLNELIMRSTDRKDLIEIPKVVLAPAAAVDLSKISILEQLCWAKSILHPEDTRYLLLNWASSRKSPKSNFISADLLKDISEFVLLPREKQLAKIGEKFGQLVVAHRLINIINEVDFPLQIVALNGPYQQLLQKLSLNHGMLKSHFEEVLFKSLLLQVCFTQAYEYIKYVTRGEQLKNGRSAASIIRETDQWKEDLSKL